MTAESLLKVSQIASNWGQPVSIVALVSICFWQARMMNGRLTNKVSRDTCHAHTDGIKEQLKIQCKDIKEIQRDVKEILKRND